MHLLHLSGQILFVCTLAHYLMFPPEFTISDYNPYNVREVFLVVMAASSLLPPNTAHSISHLLVLLAFLLMLPLLPLPGTVAFTAMHIAFVLLPVTLHLPYPPSIAFLLCPTTSVPAATMLVQYMVRIALPLVVFLMPAILFACCLVSISLADPSSSLTTDAVPIQSRTSFFILLVLLLALVLVSVVTSLFAMDMSSAIDADPWDRYSPAVGRMARKSFYRTVTRYTGRVFCPPFNLLRLTLVALPSFLFTLCGRRMPGVDRVERFVWRLSVGVVGAVLGGVWLWGLV